MRGALLAALLAAACTQAAPSGPEAPERVLVLVLDACHADHLGCYGGPAGLTPAIDALAARGRRFDRALSNTTWTLPSTVSLLTGQLQEHHGVVTNRHRLGPTPRVLPEVFSAAGWTTQSFVQMVYASAVHGLDRGFDEHHYYSMTAGPHPGTMVPHVVSWMEEHAGERYLLYVHLRRPHSPYDGDALARAPLEDGCDLADGRRDDVLAHADSLADVPATAAETRHVEHLYRGNLATVDRAVARILSRADARTLVVLTSDHGEALGQHEVWGHGYALWAESIDVPLVIAGPGVVPGVDRGPACTIDIAPTLLEACGLPASDMDIDGRSLLPRLRGRAPGEDRPIPISARYRPDAVPAHGVVLGDLKAIVTPDDRAVLHDRRADRGDLRDLGPERADVLARLAALARSRRADGLHLATRGTEDFDVPTAELRALGYLGR